MVSSINTAIALDLGTTSIKAGLLNSDSLFDHIVSQPAPTISTNGGRYESDALTYAKSAEQVLKKCLDHFGTHSGRLPPLGLCSQRSSFLIWDRTNGKPLTPLISWQDNRGATSCSTLRHSEKLIRDLTGLRLSPYYFAPKLCHVLLEHPEWRRPLERGELLAGTLDTFLIWRWTDGMHHVTDASMAARTLLMDIRRQKWSDDLCELFGIAISSLPEIISSTALNIQLNNGLTLQASVGDQSAAFIASIGDNRSDVLVNLGTGGFVIRSQGTSLTDRTMEPSDYLRTLVYQDSNHHAHLALEGTLNSLAVALAPYPVDACHAPDPATKDIFCTVEPSGLGAPYFREDIGIRFSDSTETLTPQQIASLLLEGIIFRVARILENFHCESPIERAYLSGGLSKLNYLQQGISQCAPCNVYLLQQIESSLQGAALLAGGLVSTDHKVTNTLVQKINSSLPEKYGRWKMWFDNLFARKRGVPL